MDKIAKSRSKNKIKGNIPQLYLKPSKKESLELKPSKIPKKKLKFNESNRRFGNDITNSIKNNAQYINSHHSFHQKSSSVSNKANVPGTKQGQTLDNNSSLKKANSNGRNNANKNVEKTFSGDNLYHKKKINESIDNKQQNNYAPSGPKLKQSNTNINKSNIENEKDKDKIPSPKNRDKLIRISEYRIEPVIDSNNNKNENKNSLNNNKDLINRLKNQSCSLKSSITNKNQNNNSKNKTINHIFDAKEFLAINKHLTKEQLIRRMNILSKHDTFELGQKKNINGDKNKFNKNAHVHKDIHNNSNNFSKNKNKKPIDILFKIKNLKTFHPNKQNNKSLKKNKENKENIDNNINENEALSNDKIKNDEKKEKILEEKEKEINHIENKEIDKEQNENKNKDKKEEINKQENINEDKDIQIKNENTNNLDESAKSKKDPEKDSELTHIEHNQDKSSTKNDKSSTKNDTTELNISQEKVIYFDTVNINNVQIPKEYLNTIYYNLLVEENLEITSKPVHTYMKKQKEINDQMRSILVDWIIDVHHKFGFTDETLFMTISIIDRYCSSEQISRIKYQCLGITALMIACKHEEINVPKVEDFIYITDNAYTKEEVFKMENDVLSKLNFSW